MGKKVFVSYSHAQKDWVWNRLAPCLKAGGAEVLIDRERFEAGRGLAGQMDAAQDQAEVNVLVLSPEYLLSPNCLHEMRRAVARDPHFEKAVVVPVRRVDCMLPAEIADPNPLYVNLTDAEDPAAWKQLLDACGADLGATAPDWLRARDDVVRLLRQRQCANVVVTGRVNWRALISDIRANHQTDLTEVDLDRGTTVTREGLVAEILTACGSPATVPRKPNELAVLQRAFDARQSTSWLALLHFDNAVARGYGVDFFPP